MKQRNGFRALTGIGLVVATPVVALATWVVVTGAGGRQLQADAGGRALELRPDVALLDIELPHVSGIDAAVPLAAQLTACRVVMVTTFARTG